LNTRVGEVWEIKSFLNGERVVVVMESKLTSLRHDAGFAMLHKILQITGKKEGRLLVWTEYPTTLWEEADNMKRLDA